MASSQKSGQGQQRQSEDQSQKDSSVPWIPAQQDQKPFQCGLCSVTFEINVELVSHIRDHSRTKPYQCGYCKVSYDNNPELIVHINTHTLFMVHIHSTNVDVGISQPDQIKVISTDPPATGVLQDTNITIHEDSGNLSSSDKSDITASRIVSEGTENFDDSTESDDYIKQDLEVQTETSTENIRERRQSAERTRRGNGMRITGKPFRCDICGATFKAARYVNDHKRRIHKISITRSCQKTASLQEDVVEEVRPGPCREIKVKTESGTDTIVDRRKVAGKYKGGKTSSEKPFQCDICGATSKAARYVKDHKRRVHNISFTRTCQKRMRSDSLDPDEDTDSDPSLAMSGLETTEQVKGLKNSPDTNESNLFVSGFPNASCVVDKFADTGKCFKCSLCGKMLKCRQSLKRHKMCIHFKCKSKTYPCSQCTAHLGTKKGLANHVLSKHTGDADNKKYQCMHCPAQFKMRGTLSAHVLIKHNDVNNIRDDRPYACPHCPWKFKQKCNLRNHIARVHEDQRYFICLHCKNCFKSKCELTNHMNRKHNTETPHQCADCGKCFKVKAAFLQHFCKPKECPICNHLLNCRASYYSHMRRIHSKQQFQCSFCEFTGFLTQHEVAVHNRTHPNAKPHVCEFCGQSFSRSMTLTFHRNARHLNNRPYKCSVCQKGFNSKPSMFMHIRRHTGDRRYPCDQCDKKFYNSSSLQQHSATHTELRPHACTVCGKTYRFRGNLVYHLKHSHPL